MISDVGRWVGQRGSDVRSTIFEFLLFPFISRLKDYKKARSIKGLSCSSYVRNTFAIKCPSLQYIYFKLFLELDFCAF